MSWGDQASFDDDAKEAAMYSLEMSTLKYFQKPLTPPPLPIITVPSLSVSTKSSFNVDRYGPPLDDDVLRASTPPFPVDMLDNCAPYRATTPPPPLITYGTQLEMHGTYGSQLEKHGMPPTNHNVPRERTRRNLKPVSWDDNVAAPMGERVERNQRTKGFIFMRKQTWKEHTWYEYLMEFRGGKYNFIEVFDRGNGVNTCIDDAIHKCARRGMLFMPKETSDVKKCFQQDAGTYIVYLVPMKATQRPRPDRKLNLPPSMYWVTESELACHVEMGGPEVFGQPIDPRALQALHMLPMHLQFASMTPPRVLYHGTDTASADSIAVAGMLPSAKSGMLGPGIYLAKIQKAVKFTKETAERVVRGQQGLVVRVIAFPQSTIEMERDKRCECGCDKPFVDHLGKAGAIAEASYIPDNSMPATRHAEWCIRNPDCLLVDGLFSPNASL